MSNGNSGSILQNPIIQLGNVASTAQRELSVDNTNAGNNA